jgi:hypothetical protein
MDKPLKEHISRLKEKIEFLKKQLAETGRSIDGQRSSLRNDLIIAERALAAFRKAYELERRKLPK